MRKCGLQKTIEMNSLHGNSILTSIQCHFCARDFDSSIYPRKMLCKNTHVDNDMITYIGAIPNICLK